MKFRIELFRGNSVTAHKITIIMAPTMKAAEETAEKMRVAYKCSNYKVVEL